MTGRHHRQPRLTARRVAIADAGLLALSLTIALAASWAPEAHAPHAAALPTAVEKAREPSGHGGPIGPLATPSIGADGAWQPEDGPVSYGQALRRPPAITTPPAKPTEAAAEPEPTPGLPEVAAEPQLAEQPATGLLALVNADRAQAGCGPVAIADDLTSQAQTHSNAQAAADQMFHSAGVSGYDTWGENVAYGYGSEAEVHDGWMASEGHRANITNCTFTFIGYASADSETGVRYWTQVFAA